MVPARAGAGEIAAYRPAPGNFDAWRHDHPAFNPFQLSMVQAKSHVLAQALGGLETNAAELLRTIAAFRSPVEFGTLHGLFVERGIGRPSHSTPCSPSWRIAVWWAGTAPPTAMTCIR